MLPDPTLTPDEAVDLLAAAWLRLSWRRALAWIRSLPTTGEVS